MISTEPIVTLMMMPTTFRDKRLAVVVLLLALVPPWAETKKLHVSINKNNGVFVGVLVTNIYLEILCVSHVLLFRHDCQIAHDNLRCQVPRHGSGYCSTLVIIF